jgi:hypothetical protein
VHGVLGNENEVSRAGLVGQEDGRSAQQTNPAGQLTTRMRGSLLVTIGPALLTPPAGYARLDESLTAWPGNVAAADAERHPAVRAVPVRNEVAALWLAVSSHVCPPAVVSGQPVLGKRDSWWIAFAISTGSENCT